MSRVEKLNPFDPGYYSEADLAPLGFRSIGRNVQIARNCTIIGLENISFGDNVRIDGYCTITAAGHGSLDMGSYVHIAAYCLLSAADGITMRDFSGLSQGVRIYSRTDDYSGAVLTNPTVPTKYTGIARGAVVLAKHVIIGSGSVILPGVVAGEGAAVGALSLVTRNLDPWTLYAGSPARRLRERKRDLLALEADLWREAATDSKSVR